MPNPLTAEERARLPQELRDVARWLRLRADGSGNGYARDCERAAVELARTADDARDAQRYRFARQNGRAIHIEMCVPPYGNAVLHGIAADEAIDEAIAEEAMRSRVQTGIAALASSKSEDRVKPVAAEGGEDG